MRFKQNKDKHIEKLVLEDEIGHGAFGKVYSIYNQPDIVIKIINLSQSYDMLLRELNINATLTKLNNINILTPLRIYHLYNDDINKKLYGILYQRITGTWNDLKDYIQSNTLRQFSLCIQIMLAFLCIHRNLGITHADMSDTNFLVLKLNKISRIKYKIQLPNTEEIIFMIVTDTIAILSDFGSITSLPDTEEEILDIYHGLNYDFNSSKYKYLFPEYCKSNDYKSSEEYLINFIKSLDIYNNINKPDFTCFISNKKVRIRNITTCKNISNNCIIDALYKSNEIQYILK